MAQAAAAFRATAISSRFSPAIGFGPHEIVVRVLTVQQAEGMAEFVHCCPIRRESHYLPFNHTDRLSVSYSVQEPP